MAINIIENSLYKFLYSIYYLSNLHLLLVIKILSGIEVGTNQELKNLHEIDAIEFGSYLDLVELTIYEVESLNARFQKIRNKIRNRTKLSAFIFAIFFIAWIVCPATLLILSGVMSILPEHVGYNFWLMGGIAWMYSQFRDYCKVAEYDKYQEDELTKAFTFCIVYVEDTLNAFYNKSEVFQSRAKDMPADDFRSLKKWILEIEADFTVFTDIVYKNDNLNKFKISDSKENLEQRNFSKKYLLSYLERLSNTSQRSIKLKTAKC